MQASAVTAKDLAGELMTLWSGVMRHDQGATFRLFEEAGLGMTQVKTLHALNACVQELSVKELSDRLGISLPAASRTIEGLLKRGLAERREDEHDRRMKRVRISAAGRALVERIATARFEGLEAFAESLPADRRAALHTALSAVNHPQD